MLCGKIYLRFGISRKLQRKDFKMEKRNISLADIKKRLSDTWQGIRRKFIDLDEINKTYLYIWLSCFLILVVWGIVFKCNFNHLLMIEEKRTLPIEARLTFQLVPLTAIKYWLNGGESINVVAYVLNFVALIPFGFLLGLIMSEKRALLLTLTFILCIEIFQLFSYFGVFDFADILINALGSFVGYRICVAVSRFLTPKKVNTVCAFLTIPLVLLTIFAIVRTIILFPV